MILLVGASALYLTALQASISAPRAEFTSCLKQASARAGSEKVTADGFEAYVRGACSSQVSALKSALVAWDVKNGSSKKSAAEGAELTISDYLQSSLERYTAEMRIATPAPAAQAAAVPAAVTTQPPKQ